MRETTKSILQCTNVFIISIMKIDRTNCWLISHDINHVYINMMDQV